MKEKCFACSTQKSPSDTSTGESSVEISVLHFDVSKIVFDVVMAV